jgi:RHH-type proline utilization regulon transcriptional repressor/proline dehydrogenase/delta 1-pyrroline-5-carboxylate dehydrogenase
MLQGAMAELCVGDPRWLGTDIGPVIDEDAKNMLNEYVSVMREKAVLHYQVPLPEHCQHGHFFAPCLFEIRHIRELPGEIFGPVLHVITYTESELPQIIKDINDTGYGLTFGIHSRIQSTVATVTRQMHAGNMYVNRSMIGAVVGVQAFGGEGLSGTGPKAGGPFYLLRLTTERSVTVDTTAAGGNASLLSLEEN